MSKFTLKRIDLVKGKIKIFKLLVNGNCEFDAFCEVLEREKKDNVIGSLFATLEAYANIQMLPGTRFKELKRDKSDPIKDYEIKSGNYRIYLFKDSNGGIVIFGGTRKNQKSDIKRFRALKHEYTKTAKI